MCYNLFDCFIYAEPNKDESPTITKRIIESNKEVSPSIPNRIIELTTSEKEMVKKFNLEKLEVVLLEYYKTRKNINIINIQPGE